jgi:uncharacterized Zn finger protein (UPF0148 family)
MEAYERTKREKLLGEQASYRHCDSCHLVVRVDGQPHCPLCENTVTCQVGCESEYNDDQQVAALVATMEESKLRDLSDLNKKLQGAIKLASKIDRVIKDLRKAQATGKSANSPVSCKVPAVDLEHTVSSGLRQPPQLQDECMQQAIDDSLSIRDYLFKEEEDEVKDIELADEKFDHLLKDQLDPQKYDDLSKEYGPMRSLDEQIEIINTRAADD